MNNLSEHIQSSERTGQIRFHIEERNPDRVISRMPVIEGILNPYGVVQAGAMIWLADVTASILVLESRSIVDNGAGFPLAVDIHTTLLGNQKDGEIFAEAGFVRKGKTVSVVRTRITGNGGKLLAEVTSTHIAAK